jgi:hypothetical protein
MSAVVPSYVLLDPRPIAEEAPYTFFLPGETEVTAIASGDFVKLMFEHVPAGKEWSVERMWVAVGGRDEGGFWGALANNALEQTAQIRIGDSIRFAPHHIINIRWSHPESAPRPVERREYWERCLVDSCVLEGTEPVEFIYREFPDMQKEGDKYPDSGWRIRGRVGTATDEEVEAREPRYVAIGAVLNKDDSWLHLIDAPEGARFMRDFRLNTYVNQS